MINLLSYEQYTSIADSISLQSNALIDGKFVPSTSGRTMATVNPATGKKIADVAACDKEDVDTAVASARNAFESGVWSRIHPSERKKIILRFVALLESNMTELAVLECMDSGKPIRDFLLVDFPEVLETFAWHAEYVDKRYGSLSPSGKNKVSMIDQAPAGVVACVLPWNFPLIMAAWKIAPALSEGNSVIVKPASLTSLSTLKLAEYALEAGIPAGVLNVVTGSGAKVGEALGRHPDINVLSFTGSTAVGRSFLHYAAESNLKRVVLELGGKNPFIVLDDVTDFTFAARHAVSAAFWNMGQSCTSNSRIIVVKNGKDALLEAMLKELESWRIGAPLDPANALGSVISKSHYDTVMEYINKGIQEGGKIVTGGNSPDIKDGVFINPTIFDNVLSSHTIAKEEIFGPVAAIITADSNDQAVQMANNTEYGLHASIFTENITTAHKYAMELDAGIVSINAFSEGDVTTPFGGHKLSGFGGKDKGRESHEQYLSTKTIILNLDR